MNSELPSEDLQYFNEFIGKKILIRTKSGYVIGEGKSYAATIKPIEKKFIKIEDYYGILILMNIDDISFIKEYKN